MKDLLVEPSLPTPEASRGYQFFEKYLSEAANRQVKSLLEGAGGQTSPVLPLLLKFWTGFLQIPACGFPGGLHLEFQTATSTAKFPEAHTCMKSLVLPVMHMLYCDFCAAFDTAITQAKTFEFL